LKIPPGTQPGTQFRIKGKGVPHLQDERRRGDLLVVVDLQVPRNLDSRQRKLLEELARSFGQNGKAEPDNSADHEPDEDPGKEKGLFDRIKDAFG
ncbi:MAG TPA: DnaJ C-terminal domain-containing protein, partial [Dehalococcoidia bacterium]|nr:DnaJ C-terminal domain-containing protein [Dehalococcoidia bacterium]